MTNEVSIQAVSERIEYIESLNARGVGTAIKSQQFELACLRRLLAALTAKPIKLPCSFSPDLSVFGSDARCVMRADKKGRWFNKTAVELSIRAAGYEVQE